MQPPDEKSPGGQSQGSTDKTAELPNNTASLPHPKKSVNGDSRVPPPDTPPRKPIGRYELRALLRNTALWEARMDELENHDMIDEEREQPPLSELNGDGPVYATAAAELAATCAPATLRDSSWPTLDEAALSGLAGEIVNTIDPYTESDKVAVLLNVLTAFGNALNGAPHARVQHDRHPANLFVVQVGDTSKGRKGTGWSTPRYLMSLCDEEFTKTRIKSGLSSGEGLIYNFAIR